MTRLRYDRARLVCVLVWHQRTNRPPYAGACTCGWGTRPEDLGLSWPDHIADAYEEATDGR